MHRIRLGRSPAQSPSPPGSPRRGIKVARMPLEGHGGVVLDHAATTVDAINGAHQ